MIKLFHYLLLLPFIIACKKDRMLSPINKKLSGLLETITVKSDLKDEKLTFNYTDSSHIKSIIHKINDQTLVEIFEYSNDTLTKSTIGDTLKKYIYREGKLRFLEKHLIKSEGTYFRYIYSYNNQGRVTNIEKQKVTNNQSIYLGDISYTWKDSNIEKARERFSNGLIEEYYYQYHESFNPYYYLYTKILRIPSEDIRGLSINNLSASMTFFSGDHFRMEGKYLENKLPEMIVTSYKGEYDSDWKALKEYFYNYYE